MHRALLWLSAIWWLAVAGGAWAQAGVAEAQQHLREAGAAYRAGDYEAFTRSLETALALNPGSYYTRYNLARGYARTGKAERALELLEGLAAARVDFGVAKDDAFDSLRVLPRFQALVARLEAATQPLARSHLRHRFDELGLIPEGIARDGAGERIFFGSMRTGEVFVVDRHSQLSRFAAVAHEGPLAAIGMTVDPARGLLWVVASSFFLTEGHDPDGPIHSGVFGFDLASGRLEHKVLGQEVGHGYNDVTVGPGGDLYLSGAVISTLAPGRDVIVPLTTEVPIVGANGIVAAPDGRHLIVSSYPAGIALIRLADGAVHFLSAPDHVPLYGIDGMYWHEGDLIAVQNGLEPWRVVRLSLSEDLRAVTGAIDLEFADPRMTATTGALAGDEICLIGQGPVPEHPPAHVGEALLPYLGRTVIVTTPLKPR